MIATHSQVISFPETHFFSETLPVNPLLRKFKLHGAKSHETVTKFLNENGYGDLHPFAEGLPYQFYTYKNWCRKLIGILDQMIAHDAPYIHTDETVWGLEKTPRHLYYISSIEQSRTSNKFIHILRQGKDVVASLHLATKEYPEEWNGERSVKKCISWWNSSIRRSLKYRQQSNHFFVIYEQLLASPEVVLKEICTFLELNYQRAMVRNFHRTAGALTQKEEKWKDKNKNNSMLNKSDKLQTHFDASTIDYITTHILDIDLKQFYH